jgi:hypothetical protein
MYHFVVTFGLIGMLQLNLSLFPAYHIAREHTLQFTKITLKSMSVNPFAQIMSWILVQIPLLILTAMLYLVLHINNV